MFEFKIYDLHFQQKFDDLGEMYRIPYDGVKWLTFDFAIDGKSVKIERYCSERTYGNEPCKPYGLYALGWLVS